MALSAALLAMLASAPVSAGPSVWSQARDPRVSVQDALVRDAQKTVLRYRRMSRSMTAGSQASAVASLVLRDARLTLARVVAGGATDFGVRLLYVEVLRESNARDEALKVVTQLLKERPPAPIRAEALGKLAILYALAERREEEIQAYTAALELEPHGFARSELLANRAEALMATGDVTAAIEGYRAALAPLTTVEMFYAAPTTLFGLGVALDRAGNPEAALEAVRLARQYDSIDKGLRSSTWFFSPSYDAHWYWALGGWSCGRFSQVGAVRSECYNSAVAEWQLYIESAPENDRWVPLAHVRLAAVKRERERASATFEAEKKKHAKEERDPPVLLQ
jgi:tetratricopeptide (TPR) repeat protein